LPRSLLAASLTAALVLGIASSFAQAAESPPAADPPSPPGSSAYAGMWTVVDLVSDSVPLSQYELGDTFPDSVAVDCAATRMDSCDVRTIVWAGTLTRTADGTYRAVEEQPQETGCGGEGLIQRTEIAATFDDPRLTITLAVTHEPRTYTNGDCTAWSTDEHLRFEGAGTGVAPSPGSGGAPELEAFLAERGLVCLGDASTGRTCTLEQPDATYSVAFRVDQAAQVTGVDASVASLDASMPSDAGGFLRGVVERTSGADGGLVAWFDQAIGGGEATLEQGPWTGRWSDTPSGDGSVWAVRLLRADVAVPSPSADPAPAGPTEGPGSPAPTSVPGAATGGADDGGGTDGTGSFAASVPTVSEVSTDPLIVLQSALLAALFVFLMPFPSQLFNSTLETHEEEVRRWLRLDRLGGVARGIGAFWGSWPGVMLATALAAVLYGFLDPTFGFDAGSLPTFVGMLLGIVLVTAAFAVPTVLAHRRYGDRPRPSVVPVSLLVGVVCVLVSRLAEFQPGYLYGLLIGFVFARELSQAEQGRATAVGAALMLIVAFLAWIGLAAVPETDGFAVIVVRTTLAALMVAGLEGVVFGLLPMRFLPGEDLYRWNRLLWSGLLLVGAFAFFHILINPASGYLSDTSRTPLSTVLALLLAFTIVSVGFWAWFRFRPSPRPPLGPGSEEAR
jgi:hypothetical protein